MDLVKWKDVEDVKIAKFPYKGKPYDVKGISVRWLSKFGDDGNGSPEYGLVTELRRTDADFTRFHTRNRQINFIRGIGAVIGKNDLRR